MSQRAKPISLLRSYVPIDPNAVPETMHGTTGEDRPEESFPVVPYEGWNFMPSAYGYRSYFGTNTKLNIDGLDNPEKCREIFVFQKDDFSNILVALCDDGIWSKVGESVGAWTHDVTLDEPEDQVVEEWSYVIMENKLIVYRQGEDHMYEYAAPGYAFVEKTPTFITMSAQMGIFKAGNRLGIWDSDGSVGWSSLTDLYNFTPSIATGANITKFKDVIGRIITIEQHDDGFVIYATKSILGVQKNLDNTFLWRPKVISGSAGIAYKHQVARANPDGIHFAWTNVGLMRIANFTFETLATEFFDFVKEANVPVYLKFCEGRYLFVELSDTDYVDGLVTTYTMTIPPLTIPLSEYQEWSEITTYTADEDAVFYANFAQQNIGHIWRINQPEECIPNSDGYCLGQDYPVYKDFFRFRNFANGPGAYGEHTQAESLYLVADYANIVANINALNFNDLGFVKNGTTIQTAYNDLYPPASIKVSRVSDDPDGYILSTLDELTANTYSAVNNAQQNEENVLIVDNNQDFFSRVNALVEIYNRYVPAYGDKIKALLNTGIGSTSTVNSTEEAECALNCAGLGQVSVNTITAPGTAWENTEMGTSFFNNTPTGFTYAIGSGVRFNSRLLNRLSVEYGVLDNEVLWAVARPVETRTLRGGYNTDKKILACHLEFTLLTEGEHIDDGLVIPNQDVEIIYTEPPEPYANGGFMDVQTALNAAIAIVEAYIQSVSPGSFNTVVPFASAATAQNNKRPFVGYNEEILGDITLNPKTIELREIDEFAVETGGVIAVRFVVTSMQTVDTYTFNETITPVLPCDNEALLQAFSYPDSYINYNSDGSVTVSETISPYAAITTSPYGEEADDLLNTIMTEATICVTAPESEEEDFPFMNGLNFNNTTFGNQPVQYIIDGETLIDYVVTTVEEDSFTFPGSDFLLQTGSPAPYDVTWKGAFVYDTAYQRWGKLKADHRQLLDFSPINSSSVGAISFTNFGVQAALLNDDGEIRFFDVLPTDSYIKFGKIGSFRMGHTTLEEVRFDQRQPLTGELEIETSLDGKTVEIGLTKTYDYNSIQVTQGIGSSGRWHNIGFRGNYDLSYLEFRGWTSSRR